MIIVNFAADGRHVYPEREIGYVETNAGGLDGYPAGEYDRPIDDSFQHQRVGDVTLHAINTCPDAGSFHMIENESDRDILGMPNTRKAGGAEETRESEEEEQRRAAC
eukprot:768719-Hanusia_phi.AAC.5